MSSLDSRIQSFSYSLRQLQAALRLFKATQCLWSLLGPPVIPSTPLGPRSATWSFSSSHQVLLLLGLLPYSPQHALGHDMLQFISHRSYFLQDFEGSIKPKSQLMFGTSCNRCLYMWLQFEIYEFSFLKLSFKTTLCLSLHPCLSSMQLLLYQSRQQRPLLYPLCQIRDNTILRSNDAKLSWWMPIQNLKWSMSQSRMICCIVPKFS
jgi:hypothetical protein